MTKRCCASASKRGFILSQDTAGDCVLQMRGVHVTLRMRLFCEVFRNGKPMEGQQYEVLNEVVVDRGANPYLTKIECYEQGRLITKVMPLFQVAVFG